MRRRTVELTRRLCRKWVALYQAHGDAGLSDKYDRYDAVFKLSVLERMWEEGLSCHDVWLGPTAVVRGSSVGAERLVRKKSADEQRKERADDNWSAALSQSGSNAGGPKRKEHA